MTISTTEPRITYTGNGSTTTFAVPFDFSGDSEIAVDLITDSTNDVVSQTSPADYSVVGTDVEMVSAPATGETLVIRLSVAESQTTDYVANDTFPAETHEAALDKLTRLVKQIKAEIDFNCVKLPTNNLSATTVTDTDIAPSKIFRINQAGTAVELASVTSVTNGGNSWDDPVDSDILVDTDSTYDLGSTSKRFTNGYFDNVYGTLQEGSQTNITAIGDLSSLTVDNISMDGNTVSTTSGDLLLSPAGIVDMSANTKHMVLPSGSTAQRDTSDGSGSFRYNTTDGRVEYYTGTSWVQLTSSGAPGSWSNAIDASITVDTDSTYDIGTSGARIKDLYADNLYGTVAQAAQGSITSLGTLTSLDVDNININGNTISASSGNVVIGSSDVVDLSGNTGHMLPPTGTTAQRTGATAGELRYNTTDNKLEYYNGTGWQQLEEQTTSGLNLLATATASSSTEIDFDNVFDGTYEVYMVQFSGVTTATDGASLLCRVGTGATPTYQDGASDYRYIGFSARDNLNSVSATPRSGGGDYFPASSGVGTASGDNAGGTIYIYSPANSSTRTLFEAASTTIRDGVTYRDSASGQYTSNTAVTSLRFYTTGVTAEIASGEFKLYGLQKSL